MFNSKMKPFEDLTEVYIYATAITQGVLVGLIVGLAAYFGDEEEQEMTEVLQLDNNAALDELLANVICS